MLQLYCIMTDCTDIMFSQYAQDPLENFTQQCEELFGYQPKEEQESKKPEIRVLELTSESNTGGMEGSSSATFADNGSNERVVLSAQYVVHDQVDEIMDLTECIVRKISKKLCS
ncbi:hypothetical protein evm_012663 [Chilo suppressalis]|nr:hypothetical protein evm_012663 [Chilo suppressalis]